jgi:hypothetical protein
MDPKQNGKGEMPFSPKLKMVANEIKAILDKYDIAGVVVLHEPTHTEFLIKVNTTNSLAFMEGKVFKCKDVTEPILLTDDQRNQWTKDRRDMIFRTLNMVVNLRIVTTSVMLALTQAEQYVRHFFKIMTPPPPPGGKMPRK